LEGDLTEVAFAIDQVGTLDINSLSNNNPDFPVQPGVTFYIRGDKTIGTDTQDDPIYKYSNVFTTDSSGKTLVDNLEWDNYQVYIDSSDGYDISATNPFLPINLLPGENENLQIALSTHTANSVLVSFNDVNLVPIASVSALLYDGTILIASASSGTEGNPNFGQVFFSDLQAKIYQLEATASGLLDYSGNIDVIGNKFESVLLNYE
jgi:hypothetical protein